MKKVSIILPIYNGEKYINKCLDSLLDQTYKNIEIIAINDGSKDKTLEILKTYKDERIKIIDKENTGVSNTRNIGIKNATGSYITFIDVDDYYKDTYISKMVSYIEQYQVDAVRCNYEIVNEKCKTTEKGLIKDIKNNVLDNKTKDELITLILSGKIPCYTPLLLIKKEILNGISFKEDIHMMEDVIFYLDLLVKINSIYISDDILYTITYNENSATNSYKNYERNILNIIEVNKYIKDILKKENLANKNNINCLNTNSLNAISDYIFKTYLYSPNKAINLCKTLKNNNYFINIIENTNINLLNFQRRKIIIYIKDESYLKLSLYFKLRKIIYKIRRIK